MRRWLKALIIAIAVIAGLALALFITWKVLTGRPMPDTKGTVVIETGLGAPVEIARDERGIPHITAATRNDAFFGQGYAHAQDRFFQMEFWRRISHGRLAELFGESIVASDIYLRTMGYSRVAEAEYQASPQWVKDAMLAYAAGVNAYIDDKKPGQLSFEFLLLSVQGVEIEIDPWTPVHSFAWAKMLAQDLGADMGTELRRLDLVRTVGVERAREVFVPTRHEGTPAILLDSELPPTTAGPSEETSWLDDPAFDLTLGEVADLAASSVVLAGMAQTQAISLGLGPGLGTNSWVVSGDHTVSGKPILCNDPHLGIQMPSIWYEVSLHYKNSAGRDVNIHGFSFAGVPAVVIGHNDNLIWGLSTGLIDAQDLYVEKLNPLNPDQYLVEDEWVDLEIRTERIRVEGEDEPVFVRVRSTRNGPIVTDYGGMAPYGGFSVQPVQMFPSDMELTALSLTWDALEPGTTVEAVLRYNEATTVHEFRDALRKWDTPGQNFVIASTNGDIAFQAGGRVPIRGKGSGALPAPGWDNEYQRTGYVPFDETPWVVNPDRGWVVTANNHWTTDAYPYYMGREGARGYRAKRITDLLTSAMAQGLLSIDDMKSIQLDIYNISAEEILGAVRQVPASALRPLLEPELEKLVEEPEDEELGDRVTAAEKGLELLADWDYRMDRDSTAAALFAEFYLGLVDRLYYDEIEPDTTDNSGVGIASRTQSSIARLLEDPQNPWWDDRWTENHVESRDNILIQALSSAYLELEKDLGDDAEKWKWSDTHSTTFRNQTLGESGISIIENIFNRGPYLTSGGLNQVNRMGISSTEPSEVVHIASMRMIADLADWSLTQFTNTTGQSGHIASRHYDDSIEDWVEGNYTTRPWSSAEIDDRARARLRLLPSSTP